MSATEPRPDENGQPVPGMGAIPHEGGTTFRVWAPHAEAVSVMGTFNDWSAEANPLEPEENGYWAANVAGAGPGDQYKYVLTSADGQLERLDPYARKVTNSVGNSVVYDRSFDWGEDDFQMPAWNELVIYEMHVSTFQAQPGIGGGTLQTAMEKLSYLRELGVNAIELMPVMEVPGGISWGYNPALPFAVESDWGGPDALKEFVRAAHEHGLAVILDVVYNHFGPTDLVLWQFDGWRENDLGGIYFYNDGRAHTPWGETRPNYASDPVRQYIRDNALMWLEEYRIDGLRWDGTAYIRHVAGTPGEPEGDLPEGWTLMQWVHEEMRERFPWKFSIAEDFREEEAVTRPVEEGGAGFHSQWDGAFVHPVRANLIAGDDADRDVEVLRDAILHRFDGDAFKRIVYTESHDEVANGRARLPEEIWPDNSEHWFAKKRSTLGAALVFTVPGVPMIFQGQEFLTDRWFEDDQPLDWEFAARMEGITQLYRDLIALRRNMEGVSRGLTGQHVEVHHVNPEAKALAFHRWSEGGPGDSVVVVLNFGNEPLLDYAIGFPAGGTWELRFDSHHATYDPEFDGQVSSSVEAVDGDCDGMAHEAAVSVSPYSAVILSQP
jgi:1,4-alpha-glucan branching enzyme